MKAESHICHSTWHTVCETSTDMVCLLRKENMKKTYLGTIAVVAAIAVQANANASDVQSVVTLDDLFRE